MSWAIFWSRRRVLLARWIKAKAVRVEIREIARELDPEGFAEFLRVGRGLADGVMTAADVMPEDTSWSPAGRGWLERLAHYVVVLADRVILAEREKWARRTGARP